MLINIAKCVHKSDKGTCKVTRVSEHMCDRFRLYGWDKEHKSEIISIIFINVFKGETIITHILTLDKGF